MASIVAKAATSAVVTLPVSFQHKGYANGVRGMSCVQPVARFQGLKVLPVLKQRTSTVALRSTVSRQSLRVSCSADSGTLEVVSDVIAQQLAIDLAEVTPESKFTDLGADSLDTVEIMMALEEKFDISLDEDNAETIVTVQNAADLIQDVIAAKKASA